MHNRTWKKCDYTFQWTKRLIENDIKSSCDIFFMWLKMVTRRNQILLPLEIVRFYSIQLTRIAYRFGDGKTGIGYKKRPVSVNNRKNKIINFKIGIQFVGKCNENKGILHTVFHVQNNVRIKNSLIYSWFSEIQFAISRIIFCYYWIQNIC